MNIWFAANIPAGSCGGVARSMQGLAEGLCGLGHQTTMIVNDSRLTRCNYLLFALSLFVRLLQHANNPPDWIIARSTDGAACALLARTLGLKTKIALHNHGWEEHGFDIEKRFSSRFVSQETTWKARLTSQETTWKARLIRFPMLRVCLFFCTCCISGTVSEIRWLDNKYPRHRRKMRYVPNGVPATANGYWTDRKEIPPNFLAVGNATWKKNLHHTIALFNEIASAVPTARLFLVGTGKEPIAGCDAEGKDIIVIARENPDAMSKWYADCPYCISSSCYEGGHSFAILEAMSYGCIVFASAIPSTMEIIRDHCNGFLITGGDVLKDAAVVIANVREGERLSPIRKNAYRTAIRNRLERQIHRLERIVGTPW